MFVLGLELVFELEIRGSAKASSSSKNQHKKFDYSFYSH